jgi:hypothetical protein
MPIAVVPEFTQGQPFSPVLGVTADKTSQVTLDGLIDPFSLAVRLWMVSYAKTQLCTCGLEN